MRPIEPCNQQELSNMGHVEFQFCPNTIHPRIILYTDPPAYETRLRQA